MLYDGDDAGKKAAIRAGYLSLKFGLETNVVEIPDGIDPDDWISQSNIDDIKNKIYNGIDVIDFHFNYESDLVKTDAGKTKFINDCLIALHDIQDPIYKELQIKKYLKSPIYLKKVFFQDLMISQKRNLNAIKKSKL